MSISSSRLEELVEEKIGQGRSKHIFGKHAPELFEVLSKEESSLTETEFTEGLKKCDFKEPEHVGLISFICPPLCTYITDRIVGKTMKEFYKLTLYFWYSLFIINLIQCVVEGKISEVIPLMILFMIFISWCFREWSRDWNALELIYQTLKSVGKV